MMDFYQFTPKRVVKDFFIKFTKKAAKKSARSTFMLLTLRRVELLAAA